jgi:hypothetical protein
LRAHREQHEAEVRSPVEKLLAACEFRFRAAVHALRAIEAVIASKVGERVLSRLEHDMAQAVHRELRRSIAAAGIRKDGYVTLTLNVRDLALVDPESFEREVLDAWRLQAADTLEACADLDHPEADSIAKIVVRIPSLAVARMIYPPIESPRLGRYRDGEQPL